jgi:tetratricopeptide (TPR) repeat protein
VNPYAQFKHAEPIANIAGSVLVFRGHFDLPRAFALAQINRAANLSAQGRFAEAVRMAQDAVATSPDYFPAHAALARALKANRQNEDARQEYQQALTLARTVNSEYHEREILQLEQERASH